MIGKMDTVSTVYTHNDDINTKTVNVIKESLNSKKKF